MIAGLIVMLAQAAAPGAAQTPIRNPDFEVRDAAGAPADWKVTRRGGGDAGVVLSGVAAPSGLAAHFGSRGVPADRWTRVEQTVDATPWRGRVVRFSARMRVIDPGTHLGLRFSISRPAPYASSFYSHMAERPVAAGNWREVAMIAHVDADATTIDLGAIANGRAEFDIDDVRVTPVTPGGAPPSQVARDYLMQAIGFARGNHTDSARIDWPALEARSLTMIAGAKTPADTYPAIQAMLGTLGDMYSHLQPPAPVRVADAPSAVGTPPAPAMPSYALEDGRYARLALPGLSFDPKTEGWIATRYVAAIRDGLRAGDRAPLCGWIVGLRGNTGGNMWPMVNALAPPLGDGPYGSFVQGKEVAPWVREAGFVTIRGAGAMGMGLDAAPIAIRKGMLSVAVLIGPQTASSGEMTAMALIGRNGVRTFGAPSGGYVSANITKRMSDGAVLAIQSRWVRDRTGRDYRTSIMPDEPTPTPVQAAKAWLAKSCAK